ncbi:MAG: hypothetical protein LBD03_08740 [Methanobrevibacter sp.]|jgi:hypothetical protein|nr:hypothetical protein [Candidatus Methanovirga procula]
MDLNTILSLYGFNGEYISSTLLLVFIIVEFVQTLNYKKGKNNVGFSLFIPLIFLIQLSFAIYGFVHDIILFLINTIGLIFAQLILFVIFYYGSD